MQFVCHANAAAIETDEVEGRGVPALAMQLHCR